MKTPLLLAACFFAANGLFAEAVLPRDPKGQVSLSWDKFSEFWEKMQALEKRIEELTDPGKTPPPPAGYTLARAAYRGEVAGPRTRMEAVFDLHVFEREGWVKVPFLPASAALEEARLDGESVGVLQENGRHYVLLRKPGRRTLKVRFSLKSPSEEEAPRLSFPVLETPMTLLSLRFPRPGLEVTVEPSQGAEVVTRDGATWVAAALSPTSQVDVRWQKALPRESAGETKIYLETETLFTVSDGALRAAWTLNYSILHRGARELSVRVPADWSILSAAADGLEDWKIAGEGAERTLALRLAFAKKGPLSVSIQGEKSLGKEETVELPRLKFPGVEREGGTLALEAKGAVEVEVPEFEGLTPLDPQELPPSLWGLASQPLLHAFRYSKPYALAVTVKRRPEAAVLTTTVDYANAVTLMTARGQAATRVSYQVRNNLKQYLTVKLPEGAELWSAFVAGQPVKPALDESGAYRIPLARSRGDVPEGGGFPVELTYYARVPRFSWAGRRETVFPVPDAPVSRAFWSVYLPEDLRVLRFGGDWERSGAAGWMPVLGGALSASPSSPERDGLGQKIRSGLAELSERMKGRAAEAEPAFDAVERQEQLAFTSIAPAESVRPGVFPVAFEIPASGQLFHFGQAMIVGESPRLSLLYAGAGVVRALLLLMGLVLTGYGYRNRSVFKRGLSLVQAVFRERMRSFR
jgi:hypothetical protein